MKFLLLLIFVLSVQSFAQSGRARATPTPAPKSIIGPSVITQPVILPRATPTPKPSAKSGDDEIIRVDSTLVPIPATVSDGGGRPISNLRLEDFELRIDGVNADVAEMTRANTPIRLAMLFDNSSSVLIARDFEKEAATRFFRRVLKPERDRAALFSVADYTRLEQPFTSDVGMLTRAIEAFPEPKGATALLDGIIKVAEYLRSATGRRVLVIVSDGDDTYSDFVLEDVVRSLLKNDCQVYVVRTTDFENFKRTGSRVGSANTRALAAERRMIEITAQTGGAVYSPIDENEMNAAFTQIAADLSQQYILSYYPEDETAQRGEFRTISLTVKGRQNLTIRTRKGYYVGRK